MKIIKNNKKIIKTNEEILKMIKEQTILIQNKYSNFEEFIIVNEDKQYIMSLRTGDHFQDFNDDSSIYHISRIYLFKTLNQDKELKFIKELDRVLALKEKEMELWELEKKIKKNKNIIMKLKGK